jgi:hypothetical protein
MRRLRRAVSETFPAFAQTIGWVVGLTLALRFLQAFCGG